MCVTFLICHFIIGIHFLLFIYKDFTSFYPILDRSQKLQEFQYVRQAFVLVDHTPKLALGKLRGFQIYIYIKFYGELVNYFPKRDIFEDKLVQSPRRTYIHIHNLCGIFVLIVVICHLFSR